MSIERGGCVWSSVLRPSCGHNVGWKSKAEGAPIRVEKMVALYTSRDRAITEPLANAGKSAGRYPTFADALRGHVQTWDELWEVCDIRLEGLQILTACKSRHDCHGSHLQNDRVLHKRPLLGC